MHSRLAFIGDFSDISLTKARGECQLRMLSFNTSTSCHAQVVKVLLDAGADLMTKNNFEETPLDCAVNRGRLFTVNMLLDSGAPVEPNLPLRTTTPLHRAASAGHAEIIKALLNKNARIDRLDDEGRTCLDIAIEKEHKECCMTILQHQNWRLAMRASKDNLVTTGQTPLRLLIRKLPEVAELVFNNCLRTYNKVDEENYMVWCDYEFLDDSFIMYAPTTAKTAKDTSIRSHTNDKRELVSPYDRMEKVLNEARLYTNDYDLLVANHPLKIMVECQRLKLLLHPVVSYLLRHKWNSVGRYLYYAGLSLYLLFLLLLTLFVTAQPAPYNIDEIQTSNISYEELLSNSTICLSLNYKKADISIIKFAPIPIIVLAVAQVFKEAFQFYQRRSNYFTSENALEICVYTTAILVVLDFSECSHITGLRMHWQWILAGFCVFFAWINLLFMIRKLPKFGIYVVMFIDVFRTFIQFFVVFMLFVVAFSMLFYIWLQNKPEYKGISWSLFKTTMMMIGEMDYVAMFFDGDAPDKRVFVSPWTNIVVFAFVIIMTILLMNLLVGLAVDDIKAVQEKAELTRLAMQVDLVLNVERAMYNIFLSQLRRWSVIRRQKIFPNKATWWKRLRRRFGDNSAARIFATDVISEELDLYTRLKREQQETRKELLTLKKYIEEVSMQQTRQRNMLTAIMERLKVSFEDRDDFLAIDSQ